MNKYLKLGLERLSGHRIWLEDAADGDEVRSLIADLKVTTTTCPLVRIGSAGDGGYLVPDDLDGITTLVSPGVSTLVGFDLAAA